jgi:dihydrofolate reductase
MSRIVAVTNLTLDGVMQAPGHPDEDRRGGFEHGGWAAPYGAMMEAGGTISDAGGLLLGRRTYENFYGYWPHQPPNPFTEWLNNIPKYVASTTLAEPLAWNNSTLLEDAAKGVAELRATPGKDIVIFGSGSLIQSLMQHDLMDEYVLLIHPLVLGSGRRLFAEGGAPAHLRLIGVRSTERGVVMATYQRAEPAEGQ